MKILQILITVVAVLVFFYAVYKGCSSLFKNMGKMLSPTKKCPSCGEAGTFKSEFEGPVRANVIKCNNCGYNINIPDDPNVLLK